MATTQRKQTAQHGNWAVTVSLPLPEEQAQNAVLFGDRAGLPIVRLEDTVTHEGLGFRPTKQRRHKVRTARSVALSDGVIVNHENCIKLFETLLPHLPSASPTTTQSSGESGGVEGERELTDKEKDVKKCVLVLATHMAHILGNKTLRREAMAALSKPLMVELTKCDWLVLNREEDWYKFVKGWAKMRVKKELGIPDEPKESPKPASDDKEVKDKAAKGEKQEGDNKDDTDQDKGKEAKKDKADNADGSDSEEEEVDEEKKKEEEKQWKAERKRLRRKWKKKDKPAYTKTPEYRKLMNEQLKGIIEHVRFAKMSLNNLAYLNREPFDIPVPVLAEAYKAHLFIDDKPFQKRLAAKGVGAVRNRRYKVLEWDINRMSSGLILSDDRMTVKANSNCSPKTIFAKAGYSSGRHKWEIVTPSDPGCSSAVGVAIKDCGLGTLLGMDSNSWAIRLDPQSYCSTGERRKNAEGKVKAGDVVTVELDMDKGVVTFSINNKVQARWKGLEGKTIYPALNLCHQDNQHSKGFLLRRA